MEKLYGLEKTIVDNIVNVVLSHKRAEKIVIFGSRAEGSYKETSDIDIAVFDKSWTDKDVNFVKDMLEERVTTPLKFDVVNFYTVAKESLRQNISKKGKVLYESGKD